MSKSTLKCTLTTHDSQLTATMSDAHRVAALLAGEHGAAYHKVGISLK